MHYTEIQLEMAKKKAANLKEELRKAKEAAKEATKVSVLAAYNQGVDKTDVRLTDKLAEVCKEL